MAVQANDPSLWKSSMQSSEDLAVAETRNDEYFSQTDEYYISNSLVEVALRSFCCQRISFPEYEA